MIFFSSALWRQWSVWHRLLNKIEKFPWFSKFKEHNWMALWIWPLMKGAHYKGREANDHTENISRKKEREQVPQSPLNTHIKRPKWPKSPTSFFLIVTCLSQYFIVGINLYTPVTLKALKSVHQHCRVVLQQSNTRSLLSYSQCSSLSTCTSFTTISRSSHDGQCYPFSCSY